MNETAALRRIDLLEKKIRALANDGIKLFDPAQGGKAFSHIGKDGNITLIPQMGAEIECTVWPKDTFFQRSPEGKIQHFLDAITDHDENGVQVNAVKQLPENYPLKAARPAGNISRLYMDAWPTCLELTIPHDHPKHKGSPAMLARLVEASKNLIRTKAHQYGISEVDFRAFPQPDAAQLQKAHTEYDTMLEKYDQDYRTRSDSNTSDINNVITSNALQFSLSFRDDSNHSGEALFPRSEVSCQPGDLRQETGQEALRLWIRDSMYALPEIYLAAGFDLTEIKRFQRLNQSKSYHEKPGIPIRLKRWGRVENGILSPSGLSEVGILCSLAAAWDGIRDKMELGPDNVIKVQEYADVMHRFPHPDEKITAYMPEGDFVSTHRSMPVHPTLPTSYDDMIGQAKHSDRLKRILNTVSGGTLGDELMGALEERADLIQQLVAQGEWKYQKPPVLQQAASR